MTFESLRSIIENINNTFKDRFDSDVGSSVLLQGFINFFHKAALLQVDHTHPRVCVCVCRILIGLT